MEKGLVIQFQNEDPIWTGNLDLDVGRPPEALVVSLKSFLESQGCQPTQPVEHSFYGWSFLITYSGLRFLIVLYLADRWVISVGQTGMLHFLFARKKRNECMEWIDSQIKNWIETNVPGSTEVVSETSWMPPSL